MKPRRPSIPQRRRVFLGCEGESERSYGALLASLVHAQHVFIDTVLLQPGSGDPLALVKRAEQLMLNSEKRRGSYIARAILLDSDRRGQVHDRDARARRVADTHKISLIWQEPCHEALLLRHLAGCETLRPPTAERALADLQRRWPEYFKGMPAVQLAARIDDDGVRRAAAVDQALGAFLAAIEFGFD